MRWRLAVLALVMATLPAVASVIIHRRTAVAPSHPADVVLWLNWEAGDFATSVYTMDATGGGTWTAGDDEFSSGDKTVAASASTLHTITTVQGDAPCVGPASNARYLDAAPSTRIGSLDISSAYDIFPQVSGRIGMWVSAGAFTNGAIFFRRRFDGSNSERLSLQMATGNNIRLDWTGNEGSAATATATTTSGLSAGTCYFVEAIYDYSAPLLQIRVHRRSDGALVDDIVSTSPAGCASGTPCPMGGVSWSTAGLMDAGSVTSGLADADNVYIDHIIISNDKTKDLWTNYANVLNYP